LRTIHNNLNNNITNNNEKNYFYNKDKETKIKEINSIYNDKNNISEKTINKQQTSPIHDSNKTIVQFFDKNENYEFYNFEDIKDKNVYFEEIDKFNKNTNCVLSNENIDYKNNIHLNR